jgi:hypothetical protein
VLLTATQLKFIYRQRPDQLWMEDAYVGQGAKVKAEEDDCDSQNACVHDESLLFRCLNRLMRCFIMGSHQVDQSSETFTLSIRRNENGQQGTTNLTVGNRDEYHLPKQLTGKTTA